MKPPKQRSRVVDTFKTFKKYKWIQRPKDLRAASAAVMSTDSGNLLPKYPNFAT